MNLKSFIRDIPDFPQAGILFRDITPLLGHAPAFQHVIKQLSSLAAASTVDAIAGIESRGFIFGAPVAAELGIPFVPIRKPGKLPAQVHTIKYALEYGSGSLEIHRDAFQQGARVAIIDDLLATGGTASAAATLAKTCGASVATFLFLIELKALEGRKLLQEGQVHSLVEY